MKDSLSTIILGDESADLHTAAIDSTCHLRLVGRCSLPGGVSSDGPNNSVAASYEGLLNDDDVELAVVLLPVPARHYWLRKCAEYGKSALCMPPLAGRLVEVRNLVSQFAAGGLFLGFFDLFQMDRIGYLCNGLRERSTIGPILSDRLSLSISQQHLSLSRQGVLDTWGYCAMSAVIEQENPVDWIHARGHSLGLNRPWEDKIWVHMGMKNGSEVVMDLDGLGEQNRWEWHLSGRDGVCRFSAIYGGCWDIVRQLSEFYNRVVESVRTGAVLDAAKAGADAHLLAWIHQAARHEKIVYRNEVRLD